MKEKVKITETVRETVHVIEEVFAEGFNGVLKVYYIGGSTPERINNALDYLYSKGYHVQPSNCDDVKWGCVLFKVFIPTAFYMEAKSGQTEKALLS